MATAKAVLGVIRASRPTLQSAIERVAFAIHSSFLAAGYSIVAVGANVNTSANGMDESSTFKEVYNLTSTFIWIFLKSLNYPTMVEMYCKVDIFPIV
jgi:hypothetical protein